MVELCARGAGRPLQAGGTPLAAALRITRQLVLERLLCLDCAGEASMPQVTGAMTALAEFALDAACTHALAELDALHGVPRSEAGERARLWIMGMGKLGARELNVSSDIDLIYVYDQDGETDGNAEGQSDQDLNIEMLAKALF